jgi:hypothetical protein
MLNFNDQCYDRIVHFVTVIKFELSASVRSDLKCFIFFAVLC